MGRKKTTAAKKRVLRSATNNNIAFVVETLPELKEPAKPSAEKIAKLVDPKIGLDSYLEGTGTDTDEDYLPEMPTPKKPLIRTYCRRRTIDDLMADWDIETQNICTYSDGKEFGRISYFRQQRAPWMLLWNGRDHHEPSDTSENAKKKEKHKLTAENAKLAAQNAKLQEALTSKLLPEPEVPFKNVTGNFLDPDLLRQLSIEAETDYLFVKFVMLRLWPDGFFGRSVTGRPSNNPSGRSKPTKTSQNGTVNEGTTCDAGSSIENTACRGENMENATQAPKQPLEKEKVEFVFSCLYQRRIFLRDDSLTAQVHAKAGKSLMTRVIANASRKH
ncbi:uncharacterized protein LOC134223287 [Armigeres subalbatus]|uniref:uncharacterized protein LOC134223287 n=1 Tax=Armigeres subalbatus TaxID=124917 RepID=UPI002ED4820A